MFEYREEYIESKEKTLKDFIPLVLTFFLGLSILSIYQNTILYSMGVLDSIFNISFLLYLLHHLGFTAVTALLLAFVFNLLENKKPGLGLKASKIVLMVLLIIEAALITYYVQNFEPLGYNLVGLFKNKELHFSISQTVVISLVTLIICFFSHKYIASLYTTISRMYPLTIVFFSIFLATLYSDKKPVNENKIQHLTQHVAKILLQSESYEGREEFPLLQPVDDESGLSAYFNVFDSLPNIKIIIVDGLGNDLVHGKFKGFMPYLQQLESNSLTWTNFLSNTGESYASFPTIVGSLPFGEAGFTTLPNFTYRNTLFSILKENGYSTSFNYGGNTALHNFDRFLEEEGVDLIYDRNNFGKDYKLQDEDAAGITLGYPDKALFANYNLNIQSFRNPRFDVFTTLSTRAPFHIPSIEKYEKRVTALTEELSFEKSSRRFIERNKELFASFIYADEAIAEFMKNEKSQDSYSNTIYIITGSHQLGGIDQENPISKYRVPLLLFSPLLKSTGEIKRISSHMDIAPSIVSLLSHGAELKKPRQLAWIGDDLVKKSPLRVYREIPLLRSAYNFQDFVVDDMFLSDGDLFRLDQELNLLPIDDEEKMESIEKRFHDFKSINRYVTEKNRIIPETLSLVENKKPDFSKEEMIWIESVFNGKDFDDAYSRAKNLAFNKDYGRALLLSEYILSKIPRHADTEILIGRIHAWKEDYRTAIKLLNETISKYPKYEDGYCALMDAYYWSDQNQMTYEVQRLAKKNSVKDKILDEKFNRSIALIIEENNKKGTPVVEQETEIDNSNRY